MPLTLNCLNSYRVQNIFSRPPLESNILVWIYLTDKQFSSQKDLPPPPPHPDYLMVNA